MFQPTSDYILVKPVKRLQSHILEVVSNEKYSRGLVVAVGPGERITKRRYIGGNRWEVNETGAIRPMQVRPGDWVTVENHGSYGAYSEGGVDYWIMQEKDVAFISEREYIDAHHSLTDAEIDHLLACHRVPQTFTATELVARNATCSFLNPRKGNEKHAP